jgi:hypothetical protein
MNRTPVLLQLLIVTLFALGCGAPREDPPPPASPPPPTSDSVRILTISPEPGTTLRVGDRQSFQVEVEYELRSAATGTVTLVIQKGEYGDLPLANETEVIEKGSGTLTMKKEIEIPDTRAIQVFTPLHTPASGSTTVVDSRAYKVVGD